MSDRITAESPYITDDEILYVKIYLTGVFHGTIAAIGVFSNALNLIIFATLGLKDGMSFGVFALSLTDFLATGLQLAMSMCYAADVALPHGPVDLYHMGIFVFGWANFITYMISCWITALISVERCFCVVMPFKVRQIFSRNRCAVCILLICLVHVGVHIPLFVPQRWGWVNVTSTVVRGGVSKLETRTVLTAIYTDETSRLEEIVDIIAGISLSLISQVIVIVCGAWMIYALQAASTIRSGIVAKDNKGLDLKSRSQETTPNSTSKLSLSAVVNAKMQNLSEKELRLVKVVLFLAILLSVCNIPKFLAITLYHTIPGLKRGTQINLNFLIWELSHISSTICSSSNFIVYLILNSKYREVLKQMFNKT